MIFRKVVSTCMYVSKLIQFYNFCLNATDDNKYNKLLGQIKDLQVEKQKTRIKPARGIPNSAMLATYIHLSEQMQAVAYRNAKGMNGDGSKIINTLACRCVNCGRLIQSGDLCVTCKENADLKQNRLKTETKSSRTREPSPSRPLRACREYTCQHCAQNV